MQFGKLGQYVKATVFAGLVLSNSYMDRLSDFLSELKRLDSPTPIVLPHKTKDTDIDIIIGPFVDPPLLYSSQNVRDINPAKPRQPEVMNIFGIKFGAGHNHR